LLEAELLAGLAEGSREVARAVIDHDALDLDSEACVIDDGPLKEGDRLLQPAPSSFLDRVSLPE
jgi:hypothetical protein